MRMRISFFQKALLPIFISLLTLIAASQAQAQAVTVVWDKNPVEEQVNAYIVSYGKTSRESSGFVAYDVEVDVGDVDSYVVDVNPAETYYFSIQAKNIYDLKSGYSIEKMWQVNLPTTFSLTASAGAGGSITPEGVVEALQGETYSFTITPDQGYGISDVLIDGASQGSLTSYTFSNVSADHTVEAAFEVEALPLFAITASAGQNGSISPSGTIQATLGDDVLYEIIPAEGYLIQDLVVDGVSQGALSSYALLNVMAAHTINALFEPEPLPTYEIFVSVGPNGSIAEDGTVAVASENRTITASASDSVSFVVKPDAGYQILDVLVDGQSIGPAASYTFASISNNHTFSASFAFAPPQIFTVSTLAGPNGSISPAGNTQVVKGSSVTCAITPDSGYRVLDVLVDGVSQGPVNTHVFSNVAEDHAISASFEPVPVTLYAITATFGANGSISPYGTTKVGEGAGQTYEIVPEDGYRVLEVFVDGVSQGAVASYSFSNVTADHSISASFETLPPKTYSVSILNGEFGTTNPAGAMEVGEGENLEIAFMPEENYGVADVLLDGVSLGLPKPIKSFSLTGVNKNCAIEVVFVKLPSAPADFSFTEIVQITN